MSALSDYIEKELKKGFSKEQIKGTLLKYNYPEGEINKAFDEIKPIPQKERANFWKYLFIVIVIIVVISVIGLFFTKPLTNKASPEKTSEETEKEIEKPLTKSSICEQYPELKNDTDYLKKAGEINSTELCKCISKNYLMNMCKSRVWEGNYCMYLRLSELPYYECVEKMRKK